jgi:hypothetical protein
VSDASWDVTPMARDLAAGYDFQTRKKYCHNGTMAFAHHPAWACQGSRMAMMAPSRGP